MSRLGPYELGYNQSEEAGIYCGDARELAKAIPDESVDLIFTDPVYDRIEDYAWLAEMASRILKPDSWCLCYYGIGYLPQTVEAMSQLQYEWHHVSYMPTLNARGAYRTFSNYRGLLRYRKGSAKPYKHIRDLHKDTYDPRNDGHKWAKNLNIIADYIQTFSLPSGIIFDPFCGGGSMLESAKMLNRRYLAFEIDPDTAATARQRVHNTQPPLALPDQPEQLELV